MTNIIIFIISFLLGGGLVIAVIRNDIKKLGYTNFISGMYLKKYSGAEPITEDRAFQLLAAVKDYHPDISIGKMTRIWINRRLVKK